MDIQLFATDEELKEFPEDKTDPDTITSPNSIHLLTSDLPRPHTDLPKSPSSLPGSITKLDVDARLKETADANLNPTVKTP